jgi:hypothetical protein
MDQRVKVELARGKARNMEILRGGIQTYCIALILLNRYCEYLIKENREGFGDFKKRGKGGKEKYLEL